jgi:hypothetical protein
MKSETFQVDVILSRRSFEQTIVDIDYKTHIKKNIAHALADKILESNRAKITYIENPNDDTVKVIGRVIL